VRDVPITNGRGSEDGTPVPSWKVFVLQLQAKRIDNCIPAVAANEWQAYQRQGRAEFLSSAASPCACCRLVVTAPFPYIQHELIKATQGASLLERRFKF
jgi:hypothetical protein